MNLFGDKEEVVVSVDEEYKAPAAPKLFDWLGSITTKKNDMRSESMKGFEPYIINKGLGQSEATVGFANIMNRLPNIPKEQQYLFLLNGVPKHRSYAKWTKIDKFDKLKEVAAKLGYSEDKAREAILVLGEEGVKELLYVKGGVPKPIKRKKK